MGPEVISVRPLVDFHPLAYPLHQGYETLKVGKPI
jgi:hypothetical protein